MKNLFIVSIIFIFSIASQGSETPWLNGTFVGRDANSGASCIVKTDAKIDKSLFGDSVEITVTVGNQKPEIYKLTNIPIFKGSSYGAHYYFSRDTYWAELNVQLQGSQVQFEYSHLVTRPEASIVEYPGKGILVNCLCQVTPNH